MQVRDNRGRQAVGVARRIGNLPRTAATRGICPKCGRTATTSATTRIRPVCEPSLTVATSVIMVYETARR
jgi:hypothetical protein